jgi:hypothetical protein
VTALRQNPLTVITRIKPGEAGPLGAVLDEIGNDIRNNRYIRFSEILSVHFARWVIIDSDPTFPPTLVLETNYDGQQEDHLRELTAKGLPALNLIYSKCEDYPATGANSAESMIAYLRAHSVGTAAFYIGCPGQSVASIRNAIAVREGIELFLDQEQSAGKLKGLSSLAVCRRISGYITQNAPVNPQSSPVSLDQQKSRAIRNLIFFILIALPIVLLLLPFLLVYTICLRWLEMAELRRPQPIPPPIDPRLFDKEDILVQNSLTTMVNVRPGALRLYSLKVVLWLINLLAKIFFTTGNLGGIPTIHFARWVLMDGDKRLLFFSNYDGSWASYLGDFVDKANYGLTAVWSNTDNFPPAQFLFFGGAQHITAFKEWSRQHNVYAAVWYSAYPDETLVDVKNDIQIRDTLDKILTEDEARRFLQRL